MADKPEELQNALVKEEPTSWTTYDEIGFVRHLYWRKNLQALSNYRRVLPYLDFHVAGMHVDANLVRLSLDTMIDALESEIL